MPGAWAEVDGQVTSEAHRFSHSYTWLKKYCLFHLMNGLHQQTQLDAAVHRGENLQEESVFSEQHRCASPSLPLQKVTFFGSSLVDNGTAANGAPLEIPGASRPGVVTKAGLVLFGNDGKTVSRTRERTATHDQ